MPKLNPKHWTKPVTFRTSAAHTFTVTNTEDAAQYLLTRWPKEAGPAHRAARLACLTVLDGKGLPEMARAAFIAACDEAGMSVVEVARPASRPKRKRR